MLKQLQAALPWQSRSNKVHNAGPGGVDAVTPVQSPRHRSLSTSSAAGINKLGVKSNSATMLQRARTFVHRPKNRLGGSADASDTDGQWSMVKPLALRQMLKDTARSSSDPSHFSSHNLGKHRREAVLPGSTEATAIQNFRWVIFPRATWKVRWDLWIGLIIAYSVVLVPYRIGFGIELDTWEQWLNYSFDMSFAVDVVFNFFTGYHDEDVFIHELSKIRWRYLRSWFVFDIASTVPFDQLLQFVTTTASSSLLTLKLLRTVRLFRLLKLMRLLRLKRAVEAFKMDALNAHVLQTIKSLLVIIFVTHLVSCGWYFFYTWDPTGTNWVTELHPDGLTHPYLMSFYWASNTMMSVGYGDIYGVTDSERIYCIAIACLGSVSVGMIIANIQMLTDNYNPRGIKLKFKLQETKEFLLKRGIPRRLRQRVISQFEYHWSRRTVFKEDRLLQRFPKSLQYEILAASMEPFVKRFPFFGVTSVDFFVYAVPRLRPIVLSPGQTLVDAESVWEELYFVTDGSVETIQANIIVGSLAPGDICGIEYLVSPRRRYIHTYRSVLKTELYAMRSTELLTAVQKCAVAHKYLVDLATILTARYEESARRGRRVLQKQRAVRSIQQNTRTKNHEPFLQYRHRKSISSPHANVVEAGNIRHTVLAPAVVDEFHTHWSVIHHYSKRRIAWDVLIGALVLITAISVPFRIAFDVEDTTFLSATDRFTDVMFLFDVMFSFVTTYVDDTGVEVVDHRQIRAHYFKTTFFVDAVSTVPFDFLVESVGSSLRSLKLIRTVKLVKLLRLVRLSKLLRMNAQWASELDISVDTVRLLKLLAPVLMIAHYVGCFWYYISANHDATKRVWWRNVHLDDPDSVFSKYIASVYWAIVTMTTVGFGDVKATNSEEQAFSIFVFIGGTTLFGYVVGTVIEVVSNSKSLMNREHLMGQKVNAYIKERGVSNEFIVACHEHLRFVNGEKTLFNELALFEALSYSLRSELILFLNSSVLSNVRFFDKKPKWFLTLVLPQLVPQFFMAGDLLVYQGNPVSGIFFIVSGTVVVKSVLQMGGPQLPPGNNNNNSSSSSDRSKDLPAPGIREGTITKLYEGEFFGYKEILTQAVAQYNVFAQRPTGTYLLPREFLETLEMTFPGVMDEVRALILNSINKQQTLVHHWQNNSAIGISWEDRERLLQLSMERGLMYARRESMDFIAHLQPPLAASRNASMTSARGAGKSARSAVSNDGKPSDENAVTEMDPAGAGASVETNADGDGVTAVEDCGQLQSEPTTLFVPGTDAVAAPSTGEYNGPRIQLTYRARPIEITGMAEKQFSPETPLHPHHMPVTRNGSGGNIILESLRSKAFSQSAAFPNRARRSSVAHVSMRNVMPGGVPPPLKRYPSMPEEINELVGRLLLGEGYTLDPDPDDVDAAATAEGNEDYKSISMGSDEET